MIFDDLANMIERWLPAWKPMVDQAMLFHWPVNPHEAMPAEQPDPGKAMLQFVLPYPVIALEDNASCVVLIDPGAPTDPDRRLVGSDTRAADGKGEHRAVDIGR